MSRSQVDYLRHILDECIFILGAIKNKTKEEFLPDEMLIRAVVRSIEVIGEATKNLSHEFRSSFPQVEWKKLAATRDVMIHNYFGLDLFIVWEIVSEKIPGLEKEIRKIILEIENP